MPVTVKLSREFYQRFGDKLTNELADWLNVIDATYRSDLRELNELNFARFDAKLEQRLAQFDAKLEQHLAQSDAKLEQRLGQLDATWERRFVELDAKWEHRIAEVKSELQEELAKLRAELHTMSSTLTHRMFVFWIGQAATTIALVFGVVTLLRR